MRAALLALTLTLAACGEPAPRPPVVGQEARAAMDAATTDYAACLADAAKRANVTGIQVPIAADAVFAVCKERRNALYQRVLAFRRIGYPSEAERVSVAVAEQSVEAVEPTLREQAIITIVERQTAAAEVAG